ncbi:MAG: NUDIX domain-containing protein [Candidatus Promineifilaceae bacterium]|nr:NUDIX domain-containing protein [Candidatus Promineifilaceae bacterium]
MNRNFESPKHLRRWLEAQEIDLEVWGRGEHKRVEHLWREIMRGESVLEDAPPMRLVEVVQVIVRRGNEILLEAEQEMRGGGRRVRNRPPAEKMRADEAPLAAALRCLVEELEVQPGDVTLLPDTHRKVVNERDGRSYPGLLTRYTLHIVEADVVGLPDHPFSTAEKAKGPGEPICRHFWVWARPPLKDAGG